MDLGPTPKLLSNDRFSFWVPAQAVLLKGGKSKSDGSDASGKRWIQGIASTDSLDLQGEIVEQGGIDFSYFLKYGYLNNDHKPGFDNKVGQPTECKVTSKGLWIKGFLFEKHKVADDIWELLNSIDASGSNRKVGFSIQGKVLRRKGNTIAKCWIQDIAVTPAPVNPTTWAEIAKSLSAQWSPELEHTNSMQGVGPSATKGHMAKSLSFEDSCILLQVKHNMTRETAIKVASYAFSLYGDKE